MPTALAHGLVGAAAGRAFLRQQRAPFLFWYLSLVMSILPDADVLLMRWIPYGDPFGHRGFSHSLPFALLAAVVAVLLLRRHFPGRRQRAALLAYFFLLTASHGVLDALTDGGYGIGFFAPFDNTRYFFPVHPIPVSPLGLDFVSPSGALVLLLETILFLPVAAAVQLLATGAPRSRKLGWGLLVVAAVIWAARLISSAF